MDSVQWIYIQGVPKKIVILEMRPQIKKWLEQKFLKIVQIRRKYFEKYFFKKYILNILIFVEFNKLTCWTYTKSSQRLLVLPGPKRSLTKKLNFVLKISYFEMNENRSRTRPWIYADIYACPGSLRFCRQIWPSPKSSYPPPESWTHISYDIWPIRLSIIFSIL